MKNVVDVVSNARYFVYDRQRAPGSCTVYSLNCSVRFPGTRGAVPCGIDRRSKYSKKLNSCRLPPLGRFARDPQPLAGRWERRVYSLTWYTLFGGASEDGRVGHGVYGGSVGREIVCAIRWGIKRA